MKQIFRQGDVLLIETDSLPEGAKLKNNILAYGEVTGHKHQLDNQALVYADANNRQYVSVEKQSILTHEEHKPITVTEGLYEVRIQREYDIVRDQVRAVMD
jgi:hypothetical protein